MRVAIVGCGYVADFYLNTLCNHPELELAGVLDRDRARAARFASHYSLPSFDTLSDLLEDTSIEIVVNLTNPRSHYAVSKKCLEAGKHVYSEKPLAMELSDAEELVRLAEEQDLYLASAPCNVLGESAQTVWKALREGAIGTVRLVYAEQDNGLLHRLGYRSWSSESGSPWPYKDEFEVGCTLEHAGYYLTWLVAFFGPATTVTSFASTLVADKQTDVSLDFTTPDFSVGCIQFESGIVARLTCSIVAPRDHSLRIFGDEGVISIRNCWDYGSPIYIRKRTPLRLRAEKYPRTATLLGLGGKRYPLVRRPSFRYRCKGAERMDFCRGIAEVAAAIREKRPCRLSARAALHLNELALALQHPERLGVPRKLSSACEPMDPMPWASP
jgi:predicted dehydrogenase